MSQKKKKVKILWDRVIIAVILFFLLIYFIVTGIGKLFNKTSDKVEETTTVDTSQTEESTEPENTINANYDFIEVSNDDVHKGNLILVNSNHKYIEGSEEDLTRAIDVKSGDYKVAFTDAMLNKQVILNLNEMFSDFVKEKGIYDVMLSHTYRTISEQQEIYDNAVEKNLDLTSQQYFEPGFTELNTGLAFDFGIFPKNGQSQKFDGSGDYSWIENNAAYYGFVLRYPEDKEDITGVKYDVTHYRYVGLPHSAVMKQKNLCLEEYLEEIKTNKFEQNPLKIGIGDDSSYEVYYIPIEEDDTTKIAVPKDKEYTISGNNYDGFIVTVKTK